MANTNINTEELYDRYLEIFEEVKTLARCVTLRDVDKNRKAIAEWIAATEQLNKDILFHCVDTETLVKKKTKSTDDDEFDPATESKKTKPKRTKATKSKLRQYDIVDLDKAGLEVETVNGQANLKQLMAKRNLVVVKRGDEWVLDGIIYLNSEGDRKITTNPDQITEVNMRRQFKKYVWHGSDELDIYESVFDLFEEKFQALEQKAQTRKDEKPCTVVLLPTEAKTWSSHTDEISAPKSVTKQLTTKLAKEIAAHYNQDFEVAFHLETLIEGSDGAFLKGWRYQYEGENHLQELKHDSTAKVYLEGLISALATAPRDSVITTNHKYLVQAANFGQLWLDTKVPKNPDEIKTISQLVKEKNIVVRYLPSEPKSKDSESSDSKSSVASSSDETASDSSE